MLPIATDRWMKHLLLQISKSLSITDRNEGWNELKWLNSVKYISSLPRRRPKAIQFLLYTNSNQVAIAWKCAPLSSMIHERSIRTYPTAIFFWQEGSVSLSRIYLSRPNNLTFYIKKQISNCFRHRHVYCESRRGCDAAALFISPRRQTFGN